MKSKWPLGITAFLVGSLPYVLTNRIALLPARELPMLALDRAIPFLPWTVWVYLSIALFIPVAYGWIQDSFVLRRHLAAALTLTGVSLLVFVLLPTRYPRDRFPVPEGLDPLTEAAIHFTRAIDTPANCFPSLHVSFSLLCALEALEGHREKFPLLLAWSALMSLSTLTLKQHYTVDVLGGSALATLTYFAFFRAGEWRRRSRGLRSQWTQALPIGSE